MDKKKAANWMRYGARAVILVVALFWFIFALLSGAEQLGGGIRGVILNSPNALPWLILFGFVYVAWRWEHIGGSLIALMGLFTIFMFDAIEEPAVFFFISLPLMILGGLFLGSWYLRKK